MNATEIRTLFMFFTQTPKQHQFQQPITECWDRAQGLDFRPTEAVFLFFFYFIVVLWPHELDCVLKQNAFYIENLLTSDVCSASHQLLVIIKSPEPAL